MSLMDQLTNVVVSQVAGAAAQKTGLSEGMAAKAMPMVMAVLMNGLKKNAASPAGAEALAGALQKHDGSLLNNIGQMTGDTNLADGNKILGHIFGGQRGNTEAALAKAAGVNQDQIGSLLAMAAPAVLGSLGRAKTEQNLDVAGLAGLLTQEGQHAQKAAPSELTGIWAMLDADGDGDIKDEALDMGKKLLGGLFNKR